MGAALAALPFFASLADLQPPWPPAIGFVSSALVLLSSLLAWEWTRRSRIRNRRLLTLASVALTVIGLFGYFDPLLALHRASTRQQHPRHSGVRVHRRGPSGLCC